MIVCLALAVDADSLGAVGAVDAWFASIFAVE